MGMDLLKRGGTKKLPGYQPFGHYGIRPFFVRKSYGL